MWPIISLFVPLFLNMGISQAINCNSNQEAVRAAIASDTGPYSLDILAENISSNAAPIYQCVLLKNVVADHQIFMKDTRAAIRDRAPDSLEKRQSPTAQQIEDFILSLNGGRGPLISGLFGGGSGT